MIDQILSLLVWMVKNPVLSVVLLFIEYVLLMELYAKVMGTRFDKVFRLTLAPIFLIQDWVVNVVAMSLFMLDAPGGVFEVVTGRMKRYKRVYAGAAKLNWVERWRYGFAVWLCRHLNRHDPRGLHC